MPPETTGQKVIRFIERYCLVPEGDLVGKPIELATFQKAFILDVYDNPYITDTAILSMARKNAKTATIAMLMLAHLIGPVAKLNSRVVSGALSREQAAEVYNLASKMVQLNPDLMEIIKIVPSSKKLIGVKMNVEYQAISAEGKTAHGKSPVVAILDEVGQIVGPRSDFVDAITTAQGAYDDPLLFYISTQSQSDADMLSLIIDDAKQNKPPKTVCHVYEADPECEVLDEKAWKAANPALGLFRSENDMRKQAEKASRMPSFKNTFRNLNLNQRVSTNAPYINVDDWKAIAGDCPPIEECEEVFGGFDLSNKTDLTALVFAGRIGKAWFLYPHFWMPAKGLRDRADRDKAPYDLWMEQGFISTTPKATIDYEFVAYELAEMARNIPHLVAIGFDRWRIDFFLKELDTIGADLPLVPFGQGYKDMSPAVECFEGRILNKEITHPNNPVLNMCMNNAMVMQNPAGDRKLDKMKTSGRIDGAVAAVMACGVSESADEYHDLDDFINNPLVLG